MYLSVIGITIVDDYGIYDLKKDVDYKTVK
jgi:hypothetical protein